MSEPSKRPTGQPANESRSIRSRRRAERLKAELWHQPLFVAWFFSPGGDISLTVASATETGTLAFATSPAGDTITGSLPNLPGIIIHLMETFLVAGHHFSRQECVALWASIRNDSTPGSNDPGRYVSPSGRALWPRPECLAVRNRRPRPLHASLGEVVGKHSLRCFR